MIKINSSSPRSYFVAAMLLPLVLTACGGSKTVVTQDDSAEYRTAQSLPPLRKPQSKSPVIEAPKQEATVDSFEAVEAPELAESASVTPEPAERVEKSSIPISLSASVVEVGQAAKLEIDGGFDQAWTFLSNNLRDSDLTVHNRNRAAGRFSVGCAEIDTVSSVKKTGRWSIFKRTKAVESEYCALQLVSNKGASMVSVLNRSGLEVVADDARTIFARLLNN